MIDLVQHPNIKPHVYVHINLIAYANIGITKHANMIVHILMIAVNLTDHTNKYTIAKPYSDTLATRNILTIWKYHTIQY